MDGCISDVGMCSGKNYCYGHMEGEHCHCDYCKCKHGYGEHGKHGGCGGGHLYKK